MISTCSNPDCRAAFDYRQGQLFRFHKNDGPAGKANTHSVQHFWLCGVCSHLYTLQYHDGEGVLLTKCVEGWPDEDSLRLIACA